jgi:hypothetical protein
MLYFVQQHFWPFFRVSTFFRKWTFGKLFRYRLSATAAPFRRLKAMPWLFEEDAGQHS